VAKHTRKICQICHPWVREARVLKCTNLLDNLIIVSRVGLAFTIQTFHVGFGEARGLEKGNSNIFIGGNQTQNQIPNS
jgi:hypothetical protein